MTRQEKAKAKYQKRMATIARVRQPKAKTRQHVFTHCVGEPIMTLALSKKFDEERMTFAQLMAHENAKRGFGRLSR